MNILLDYLFPITTIEPTPAASTAFLKQVCVVAKPKSGQEGNVGNVYSCSTMTAVAARTDNTDAQQLFNAGMSKVYVLLSNDLNLVTALAANENLFYTLLVSNDFTDSDVSAAGSAAVAASKVIGSLTITAKLAGTGGNSLTVVLSDTTDAGEEFAHISGNAITIGMKSGVSTSTQIKTAIDDSIAVSAKISVTIAGGAGATAQNSATIQSLSGGTNATGGGLQAGTFTGVVGVKSNDTTYLALQAAIANRCAFYELSGNAAKNLFYAFGKLLSNALDWKNQQYVSMPYSDSVTVLGDATSLFDSKISFVITDDEFSNRLSLFAAGGKAIVAPYIERNLQIDMQSKALTYISGNEPAYTKTQAALLEDELKKVIDDFISRAWIETGTVEVELLEDNFVASGNINIAEPKALWRILAEMRATL